MTVIPLRMVDHGLSYSKIGRAMSAVAIGLMVIKLLIGHLSDMLGTKNFILTALAGLGIVCVLLAKADRLLAFTAENMGKYTEPYRGYPPCWPV